MPAPSTPRKMTKEPVPWLLWLILLGTLYLFWILPRQIPTAPVRADFRESEAH